MINDIRNKYEEIYGSGCSVYRAPGRINLLGEHTDYNNGFVLPASIDMEIVFAVGRNNTKSLVRLFAFDLNEEFSFELAGMIPGKPVWSNYIKGVIAEFQKNGASIEGFDMVFGGNIPIGAGLSSSAALECGTAISLNNLFGLKYEKTNMIKLAQMAEHNYAGVKCGIMDQFASIMGKENNVIRLDCRSLDFNYFPLKLDFYQIVLCNSKVEHALANSEYNTRRQECTKGVAIIKKRFQEIESLRDVSVRLLNSFEDKMPEKVFDRCSYIVEENIRVLKASEFLLRNEIFEFGKLMYETHEGLREKYQVSCKELDFLVDLTTQMEFVAGSRMMGGGFGGCTINIVERTCMSEFKQTIIREYKTQFSIDPEIYEVEITDGAGEIPF